MSDVALKTRGVEDAFNGNLLAGALPQQGRAVRLIVRNGVQDLGEAAARHAHSQFGAAIEQAFPAAPALSVAEEQG